MPHGKKAASKTPMDAYVDGCRATWISTGHPTRTSRRSSSRPTSRPVNASGSRRHSKPCLPSLERTFKSASLKRVALRSGIQGMLKEQRNLFLFRSYRDGDRSVGGGKLVKPFNHLHHRTRLVGVNAAVSVF